MRRSLILSLVSSSIALATALVPAHTADAAGYVWVAPASACQPAKADTGHINYTGAALYNESTSSTATVFCSFPYEYYALNANGTTPGFEIGYLDTNSASSTRVACTIIVSDLSGAAVYSSTTTSLNASTSTQYMDWNISLSLFNGFNTASISCTLPKGPATATRSGIRMVRIYK